MTDEGKKTNPDALLKAITREEQKEARGHLRIFLGMCPGVGKTYAMLQAAQERRRSGVNAVVGIVETHGRTETQALLEGLEILPRQSIEYRMKVFEELDVDGILARKPELVLVDELAHTNIPGSRQPKRYHDVKEIIEAGIDVYTTMNVQHLESRIDLIRQITGVAVQETVPDSFFELADQVELIDLPPTELLKRLRDGKVYLGEMAARAIEGFFQEEKLLALRELALRFTAEVVETELHDQMLRKQISGPWQTRERILVAVSHSPYSRRLIRAARRTAFNLEASWIALYVDTGETLSDEDKAMLRKNLDMARELGAELVNSRDTDIPSAIRRIAQEKNVTQILMGRPDRRFFRDLVSGGTILDKLVRETSEIDVHVLRQVRKPRLRKWKFKFYSLRPIEDLSVYTSTFWFIALVGALGAFLEPLIKYQAVGFIFLLATIGVASLSHRGPAIFAALLSAFVWNYFFIPPKYTFYISELPDVMMNVAYIAVAVAASVLTSKIKRQSEELSNRATQTSLLYDFSRELASSADIASIVSVACRFVGRTLGGKCIIFLRDENSQLLEAERLPHEYRHRATEKHRAVAHWANENGKRAGFGTDTLAGSDVFCLPIRGSSGVIGILMFFPADQKSLSIDQETTLESACASIAISIEREKLKAKTESLRIVEESEKLYQTILDSVSHELKTPITVIMGAASALQDPKTASVLDNRTFLTSEIMTGIQRLRQVVENLLDMSRMSTGQLTLKGDLVELSEAVEAMVNEWKSVEQVETPVQVEATGEVYAKVDAKLLRNVLANLLRNALTHSSGNGELTVRVGQDQSAQMAIIEVMDEGKGLPEGDLERIFQRFYRVPGTPAGGLGLGLSIVKGITEAHGGRVEAMNRSDRSGSIFRISLPLWKDKVSEA